MIYDEMLVLKQYDETYYKHPRIEVKRPYALSIMIELISIVWSYTVSSVSTSGEHKISLWVELYWTIVKTINNVFDSFGIFSSIY